MKKTIVEQGPKYHFSTVIPDSYEELSLRILTCTPTLLYVYWDIPRNIPVHEDLLIRLSYVKDDPDESLPFLEIAVSPNETSRYVEIPAAPSQVKAVLGIRCASGTFQPLCRSMHQGGIQDTTQVVAPVQVSQEIPSVPSMVKVTGTMEGEASPLKNLIRAQTAEFKHHPDAPSSWSAAKKPVHDS